MSNPSPYHNKSNPLKAFVLGCDPTAFDKAGKQREFEYVFGITKDKRYFTGINANLKLLGLDQDSVYIQNLITKPQDYETAKNTKWKEEALKHIHSRKTEFDDIDPSGVLPVFLTSKLLYDVLLNEGETNYTPIELYSLITTIPVPADKNKLNRPLIPLFRHPIYSIRSTQQNEYRDHLIKYLNHSLNK
jgi:hypothetical protein